MGLWLVKRWMRGSKCEISAEDVHQLRDIDDPRVRMVIEEEVRKRTGEDQFEKLVDQAIELALSRKQRLSKALGFFSSQNGMVWHVTPKGGVRGLHPDGSKIRDRVEVGADDRIHIGPFHLDESRTCSCIHWHRNDDPSKSWVWAKDSS